mmetsp:Transcript_9065/g.16093  ORF Transcript_9065/g.16093 Transcript_9065/m.16093 type:complete len:81 (+) Transcript_9065:174-416(+)
MPVTFGCSRAEVLELDPSIPSPTHTLAMYQAGPTGAQALARGPPRSCSARFDPFFPSGLSKADGLPLASSKKWTQTGGPL